MPLLPCPFCNGPADWCRKGHKIMCQHCCAAIIGNDMTDAENRWNRRSPHGPVRDVRQVRGVEA
jgi:hypothetical protein